MGDAPRDPLAAIDPADLRGETEFSALTPEQRLLWLSHAAAFALEAREARRRPHDDTRSDDENR